MTSLVPPFEAQRPCRILLVATMRNEGPYILEWLAYHRAIGFTDIVVCTNDCVDGSPALLDRLQALGLVTHLAHAVAPDDKPQLAAYARAEALPVLAEAAWIMVLDADEFLNVHVGEGRVTDLIEAVPGCTAVLVNWRVFGSSGHHAWSPDFVTERFTRAAPRGHGVNRPYKTLFTRAGAYGCKLLPHQPRFPRPEALGTLRYVNGAGDVLPAYFHDESRNEFLQSEPGAVSWRLAQVNHYNTRSWDDYVVKHRRGGGLNIDWDRDANWPVFDRNEEEDATIAGRLPAARTLYDAFLADDGVRACHARCCRLYGAHVAASTPSAIRPGSQAPAGT
ncbi:glycosyltransferase family 2 protein [Methylobacterium segetis]|uniref:glycosyltransferase family 2 protein n=1 Tax=Methylobacterium segetis TaxID=2488750 RepID=UPI00104965E3|nr:glycosyltransferase family 2 protein [Methylobacterium segetis]